MRIVLWCAATGTTASAQACVPGVSYGTSATGPMNTSCSASIATGGTWPTRANAVACGGWQCSTARAAGTAFMIARWSRISLERRRTPASCRPSKSTRQMSSVRRSPLLVSVGVQSTQSSVRRQLMLPPLPSTYWRSQSLRPTSTISCLRARARSESKTISTLRDGIVGKATPAAGARRGRWFRRWNGRWAVTRCASWSSQKRRRAPHHRRLSVEVADDARTIEIGTDRRALVGAGAHLAHVPGRRCT